MPVSSINVWDAENTIVLVQPKGFGFPIYNVDPQTSMDALAGGEISWESIYQGGGYSDYVRTIQTSNPGRITGTIRALFQTMTIPVLRKMMTKRCPGVIYVLTGCSVKDQSTISSYTLGLVIGEAYFTNSPYVTGGMLALGGEAPSVESQNPKTQAGFTAGFVSEILQLAPEDISGTVATGAINRMIALQRERCAGNCGDEIEIEDEFIFVTDAPGDAYDDAELFYTGDKGATWTRNILTGIGDGSGVGLTISGNNVIIGVTGTDAGVYYAALQDVIDGTAVGVEASGVGTLAVNAVKAFGNVVIAVGDAGRVWISQDGGYSYTVLAATTVVTSDNLTGIAGMNQDLIWVYGANGVLLRIKNLNTPTVVTTGITDNILSGGVPRLRPNELYLGTDGGDIYVTVNATDTAPTFATRNFDKPAGGSTIPDLQFVGIKGDTLMFIQTDASSDSRIMTDRSGGNLGANAVSNGAFSTPTNNGYNTIAPASPNYALFGGEIESTYAFIGRLSA